MKHSKDERLIIEATADEVNELKQLFEQTIAEFYSEFRASCNLSKQKAAEIAELDRKTLSAHEKGHNMYVSTLCHDFAAFTLFMRYNKIEENEELRKLKAFLRELLTE